MIVQTAAFLGRRAGFDRFGPRPAGRLYQTAQVSGATTRFLYDGANLAAEYNGSNVLQKRYVQGPGLDTPIVAYTGSGTATKHWLLADERGSVIAETSSSGAATQINAYDEYGIPKSGNVGRFGFTGQMWIAEVQLYAYRNRFYRPRLGRFLQTDPIGQEGGLNLYAYVGNDPVNWSDPWGLKRDDDLVLETVTVTTPRYTYSAGGWSSGIWSTGGGGRDFSGGGGSDGGDLGMVTAPLLEQIAKDRLAVCSTAGIQNSWSEVRAIDGTRGGVSNAGFDFLGTDTIRVDLAVPLKAGWEGGYLNVDGFPKLRADDTVGQWQMRDGSMPQKGSGIISPGQTIRQTFSSGGEFGTFWHVHYSRRQVNVENHGHVSVRVYQLISC